MHIDYLEFIAAKFNISWTFYPVYEPDIDYWLRIKKVIVYSCFEIKILRRIYTKDTNIFIQKCS